MAKRKQEAEMVKTDMLTTLLLIKSLLENSTTDITLKTIDEIIKKIE